MENLTLKEITNIRFYQCSADVFTNEGCLMFSWDGYDTNEEVMEAWDAFFDIHDVSAESKAKWMPVCDRIYFNTPEPEEKSFKVFYCNNVDTTQVAEFATIEEAKEYCDGECKGCEPVCDGDTEYEHRATAKHYEVYDGDPRIYDEYGDVEDFKDPIYTTGDYYID